MLVLVAADAVVVLLFPFVILVSSVFFVVRHMLHLIVSCCAPFLIACIYPYVCSYEPSDVQENVSNDPTSKEIHSGYLKDHKKAQAAQIPMILRSREGVVVVVALLAAHDE